MHRSPVRVRRQEVSVSRRGHVVRSFLAAALVVVLGAGAFGSVPLRTRAADSSLWTERRPAGDVNLEWYGLASDSRGTRLIAAAFGSYGTEGWVYTSADGGATWTRRAPIGASQYWRAVASDASGLFLVAAAWSGRLYTSSDGGSTWTERTPAGAIDQRWQTVACDGDGSVVVAGASAGRLWVSADGGKTWREARPAGNNDADWRGLSCSTDGRVLLVGNYNGRLYRSADTGVTWSELTPAGAGDRNWQATACDAGGQTIVTGVEGGRLFVSKDGGNSWTERRPCGDKDRNWSRFACSGDGTTVLAADQARLYLSVDAGVTWSEQQPSGNRDARWAVCISGSGTLALVGNYGAGRLYSCDLTSLSCVLAVTSSGEGTVTLDPPGGRYPAGTVVTVTAVPEPGFAFAGWSGDVSGASNPARITMNGSKTVSASFVRAFSIHAAAGTGGSVNPAGTQSVAAGGSMTFRFVPGTGYRVAQVIVDGASVPAAQSYTFTNVSADHSLEVAFARDTSKRLVLAIGSTTLWLDDGSMVRLEVAPAIINSRTFLPLRAIVDAIGGSIAWDAAARKVTVMRKGRTVMMWIGSGTAQVDGQKVSIDADPKVVPVIVSGRTLLPLRFVAEALGLDVQWDATTKKVTITYDP